MNIGKSNNKKTARTFDPRVALLGIRGDKTFTPDNNIALQQYDFLIV